MIWRSSRKESRRSHADGSYQFAGAILGARYIETQLFGVTATDPLTFVNGAVVLVVAGVTASVIPAVRAMRIDPISVIRHI